ncbi:MAG TPA: AAA domain-containing protein, partial [Nannocystis sp.]
HILEWFDPIAPKIPACAPLPAGRRAALMAFLERLRFGEGERHTLEPERVRLIVDGLESRVQLVQGPPGTGKTTVTSLALLTRILAKHAPGEIVLVAAHTHTAVDLLLARVRREFAGFARQASAAGLSMPAIAVRKVRSGGGDDGEDSLPSIAASGSVRELQKLQGAGVVVLGSTVGTLLKLVEGLGKSAAYKKLADGFQVPLLVVDEASMMVLSHFLALATAVRADGAIMMAGDHRQLAPIMAHDWESEDRPPSVLYKPFVSAYEAVWRLAAPPSRLGARSVRIDQLAHTHRLPPVIRALIQPLYAQDGIALRGPEDPGLASGWDGVDPWAAIWTAGHRLYLVMHDEQRSQQFNEVEAAVIDAILDAGGALGRSSVAVVTPHRAQRALLRERLAGRSVVVDLVDTVERLQGGERPTILFSATESDPLVIAQSVEFILDLNRSNVAFSRTQERLVVICARTLLDFVPPETEHYASALLWKHLRALCDREIAVTTIADTSVSIRVPTSS